MTRASAARVALRRSTSDGRGVASARSIAAGSRAGRCNHIRRAALRLSLADQLRQALELRMLARAGHSKMTISVVTTSAPMERARSVAVIRSCGMARADGIGDPASPAWPASISPATVCRTQTWASQPATTSVSRPAGRRRRKPSSAAAEKWNLASVVSQSAAISATSGPQAVRVLLGADDVDAELLAPRSPAGRSGEPRSRRRGSPASAASAGRSRAGCNRSGLQRMAIAQSGSSRRAHFPPSVLASARSVPERPGVFAMPMNAAASASAETLRRRSTAARIDDRDAFWAEQARADRLAAAVRHASATTSRPPFARWFVGGRTNLCHNAVDRHLAARADQRGADLRLDRDRPGARLHLRRTARRGAAHGRDAARARRAARAIAC